MGLGDETEFPFDDDRLPPWAIGRATGIAPGAQLCTRDGRKLGNAVVLGQAHKSLQLGAFYEFWPVLTDAGTFLMLSQRELDELFFPPQWLMDPATAPGVKNRSDRPEDGAAERTPLDQVVFALQRQIAAHERQADQLHAQRNYQAELPAHEAEMLRRALALLQGRAWLTELRDHPLPPLAAVSTPVDLPPHEVVVRFARRPTTAEIDHLITLLRRAGAAKE